VFIFEELKGYKSPGLPVLKFKKNFFLVWGLFCLLASVQGRITHTDIQPDNFLAVLHKGVYEGEDRPRLLTRDATRAKDTLKEGLQERRVQAILLRADPATAQEPRLALLEDGTALHHPHVVRRLRGIPVGVILLEVHKEGLAQRVHLVLLVVEAPEGHGSLDVLGVLALDVLAGLVPAPEALEEDGATVALAEVQEPAVHTALLGKVQAGLATGTEVAHRAPARDADAPVAGLPTERAGLAEELRRPVTAVAVARLAEGHGGLHGRWVERFSEAGRVYLSVGWLSVQIYKRETTLESEESRVQKKVFSLVFCLWFFCCCAEPQFS